MESRGKGAHDNAEHTNGHHNNYHDQQAHTSDSHHKHHSSHQHGKHSKQDNGENKHHHGESSSWKQRSKDKLKMSEEHLNRSNGADSGEHYRANEYDKDHHAEHMRHRHKGEYELNRSHHSDHHSPKRGIPEIDFSKVNKEEKKVEGNGKSKENDKENSNGRYNTQRRKHISVEVCNHPVVS